MLSAKVLGPVSSTVIPWFASNFVQNDLVLTQKHLATSRVFANPSGDEEHAWSHLFQNHGMHWALEQRYYSLCFFKFLAHFLGWAVFWGSFSSPKGRKSNIC